jgi:hypothetical protein
MKYKMYIDDIRLPVNDDMIVVRSSQEAIEHIKNNGIPCFISFDHDLGGDDTSMIVVDWLIDAVLDGQYTIPIDFDFYVHSANPVGASNLEWKMSNFLEFINHQDSA